MKANTISSEGFFLYPNVPPRPVNPSATSTTSTEKRMDRILAGLRREISLADREFVDLLEAKMVELKKEKAT